jgi:hypothetical protein
MIVSSDGSVIVKTKSTGSATMIVSTTGTAYGKRGKIKSVMRFFRKGVKPIKASIVKLVDVYTVFMHTKTGKPTSIDPPVNTSA